MAENRLIIQSFSKLMSEMETKFLFEDESHYKTLADGFSKAHKEKYLCDLNIQVGQANFLAHRILVEAFTPVHGSLFTQEILASAGTGHISIDTVISPVINDIIQWMYHGETPYNNKVLADNGVVLLGENTKLRLKIMRNGVYDTWTKRSSSITDVTLCIGSDKISVNKVMLSIFSPYFAALVQTEEFSEKKLHVQIKEPGLNASTLRALVFYIYSGELTLSGDNVQELLIGARILGISAAQQACVEFVQSNIKLTNSASIYHFAYLNSLSTLQETARNFFMYKFVPLVKHTDYLELPVDLLLDLLSDDKLCVMDGEDVPPATQQEMMVYEAVRRYIEHNVEERREVIPRLILSVRLPLLEKQELKRIEKDLKMFNAPDVCGDIIQEARRLMKGKEENPIYFKSAIQPRLVPLLKVKTGPVYAGYNHDIDTTIYSFDDNHVDPLVHVTGMKIYTRMWHPQYKVKCLAGLKMYYSDGKRELYGGDHFNEVDKFQLQDDERIIKVQIISATMINGLTLFTNKGRKLGPYGGSSGATNPDDMPPEGSTSAYLTGIKGIVVDNRDDVAIRQLSFKWAYYDLSYYSKYSDEHFYHSPLNFVSSA